MIGHHVATTQRFPGADRPPADLPASSPVGPVLDPANGVLSWPA